MSEIVVLLMVAGTACKCRTTRRPPLQLAWLISGFVSPGFDFLHEPVEGVGDIVFVNGACFEGLGSVEVEGNVRHIDDHAFFIVGGIDLASHGRWRGSGRAGQRCFCASIDLPSWKKSGDFLYGCATA